MFEVSYNDGNVIFTNPKTSKSEKIALLDAMDTPEAIRAISSEQRAAVSASRAAVSLLAVILDNPRLDGFKGVTPIRENIPKELKEAIRELETEYLKPAFVAIHSEKGAKPATIEKQWQGFAGDLRKGGSYAVAKGKVTAYFAHCGKLPKADNGKLLSVAAIDKLLQNAKEAAGKNEDTGIAGRLLKLCAEVENRTESTKLGDPASAIASLKMMLATFEGLQRENIEAAMVKHEAQTPGLVNPDYTPPVKESAEKAISKAKGGSKEKQAEPAPL